MLQREIQQTVVPHVPGLGIFPILEYLDGRCINRGPFSEHVLTIPSIQRYSHDIADYRAVQLPDI